MEKRNQILGATDKEEEEEEGRGRGRRRKDILLLLIFKALLTVWRRKYSIPLDHLSGNLNIISVLFLQALLQMYLALFSNRTCQCNGHLGYKTSFSTCIHLKVVICCFRSLSSSSSVSVAGHCSGELFYSLFSQWILLFPRRWCLLDYTNYAPLCEFPRTNLVSRPDETVDKGIDWSVIRREGFQWDKDGGNTAFISAISPPSSFFPLISSFGQTLPRSLSIWITLHVAHGGNSRWNKPLLILLTTAVRENQKV